MAQMRIRRGPKIVLGLALAVLLVFLGTVLRGRLFWGPKACEVLKSTDVAAVTGSQVGASTSFVPDPRDARTTGCYLGEAVTGTYAIVFAVDREAESVFERSRQTLLTQGTELRVDENPEYRAYAASGPLGTSESLAVLRKGTYVNVLLFNAPPGSVDKLAALIASRID